MRRTTKFLAIGTAIGIGTLGGYAIAQPGPGMMGHGMGMGMHRGGPGGQHGDPAARLAGLKTELGIRADQAVAWDAYAAVLRTTGEQMRAGPPADRTGMHEMSQQEREAFMTGMRARHEASLTTIRAAAEALLPALDEAQKARAREVLPGLAARGHGMMRHAGMGMPGTVPNR